MSGHPEDTCERCDGRNISWVAPSPLWNEVMRGGDINAPGDEIICPGCFAILAEDNGIARGWRLYATDVLKPLKTVTPSGRVWDDDNWFWVEPEPQTGGNDLSTTGLGQDKGFTESPQPSPPDRTDTIDEILDKAIKCAFHLICQECLDRKIEARASITALMRKERIKEANRDHTLGISIAASKDYKEGFDEAIKQMNETTDQRLAELNSGTGGES